MKSKISCWRFVRSFIRCSMRFAVSFRRPNMCSAKYPRGLDGSNPRIARYVPRAASADGGIGRRARLRACRDNRVEVRVLFGALEKARNRRVFLFLKCCVDLETSFVLFSDDILQANPRAEVCTDGAAPPFRPQPRDNGQPGASWQPERLGPREQRAPRSLSEPCPSEPARPSSRRPAPLDLRLPAAGDCPT